MNKSYDVYMCREPKPIRRIDMTTRGIMPAFPPVIHYNPQSIAHYQRLTSTPIFNGQTGTDKQLIRKESWIQRIFGW